MKAVIFNSGLGNRMGEFTKNNHKSMARLKNGETIFHRQLRILSAEGITDFIITTGPFEDQLKAEAAEDAKLTVENGLAILQASHGLVIVLGKFAHAITQTGIENNCFHDLKTPFRFSKLDEAIILKITKMSTEIQFLCIFLLKNGKC